MTVPATSDSLWRVARLAPDRFEGWCRDGALARVFGGQVAAQALAVAGADLPGDWHPVSLHAYFVREGRSTAPITYVVSPSLGEDEQSVRAFRVTAAQAGKPILILETAFCPGPELPPPGPDFTPTAGVWAPTDPREAAWLGESSRRLQFELRFVGRPSRFAGRRGEIADGQRFWFRSVDPLPDHVRAHTCALTYVSDMFLVSTALAVHGLPGRRPEVEAATLDHAIWFHRPVRADSWLRYEQSSLTAAGGRGLTAGRIVDPAGALVATVRQEVLQRLPSA